MNRMNLFHRKPRPQVEWPFDDPPNVAVITTRQILSKDAPILFVSHDEEDGGWQFHTDENVSESDARIVSLHFVVSRDSSLKQLADLPLGWVATRSSVAAPWQRAKA